MSGTAYINPLFLTNALTVPNGGTGSTTLTGILNGNGTGGVQTAIPGTDYLASAVSALGPAGQTSAGPTVTFATSSDTKIALTITGSGNTQTFTSQWLGSLAAGRGGTGITNPSTAGVFVSSYAGGGWHQLATSSLGLLTTNIAEGSNLYWTNTRFDNRLSATTTLPSITTLANLATLGTITSGTWNGSIIRVPYGGKGATTFGQGWIFSSAGTGALAASTSPTVNYRTATSTTATSTFAAGIQETYLNITGTAATSTVNKPRNRIPNNDSQRIPNNRS